MKLNDGNQEKKVELVRPPSSRPSRQNEARYEAPVETSVQQKNFPQVRNKPIEQLKSENSASVPIEMPINAAQEYLVVSLIKWNLF